MAGRIVLTIGKVKQKAEPYCEAVRAVGLDPVVLSSSDQDADWAGRAKDTLGLVLCGGGDIDPQTYQQPEAVHPTCGGIDPVRDAMERLLLQRFLDADRPVFGICRGMQVMAWVGGGAMYQDIDDQIEPRGQEKGHEQQHRGVARHVATHEVTIWQDTLLARILGPGPRPVNSMHHQAVRHIPPGLSCNATAPDGVIEGLEMPSRRFVLGVQWHPECLWNQPETAVQAMLFSAFAAAL
ncbi:MAG: gamma-glutamyl-gamma-aminobutyrate hydrolase family protein [Candidatus Xenobia bacterium]